MILHHIGIVVDSVEKHQLRYTQYFGLTALGPAVTDPIQRVRIQFLRDDRGTLLELIEPAGENSTVSGFLAKGGGLHHVCYEVDDIESTLSSAEQERAICVCRPVPAVALELRRVCFVVYPDLGLVEFLERKAA
jgi:methylmalonyl-CoA/ethylmalonyl-CoA epimerase